MSPKGIGALAAAVVVSIGGWYLYFTIVSPGPDKEGTLHVEKPGRSTDNPAQLRDILSSGSDDPEEYYKEALYYYESGTYMKAKDILVEYLKHNSIKHKKDAMVLLAQCFFTIGTDPVYKSDVFVSDARTLYKEASLLKECSFEETQELKYNIAKTWISQDNYPRAVGVLLSILVNIEGSNTDFEKKILFQVAYCFTIVGDYAKAQEYLYKLISRFPGNDYYVFLAYNLLIYNNQQT